MATLRPSTPQRSKKPARARTPSPSPLKIEEPTTPASPATAAAKAKRKKKKPTRSVSFSLPALPFPLASFLHPLRAATSQWLVLPVILMAAGLFRWAVGLGPYSGMNAPPMHGDFEAQRHWMEVTTHVPVREWYYHDLQWWGLDYPPLTAYHSWLLGKLGALINPEWFALYTSRGLDDDILKIYMRATVIASEYLVYVPGVVIFVRIFGRQSQMSRYDQAIALAAILLQPALMLIDNGHFQYNSVMLGFTMLALSCFVSDHLYWGSFFFVLALGFKQMALYYAPAVAAYLFGLCVSPNIDITRFFLLAVTTLGTFAGLVLPLVLLSGPSLSYLLQVVHRIFPFARGLFEDKVANFWCVSNLFIKYKSTYAASTLQQLSLAATLIAILPPTTLVALYPRRQLLPSALASTAWAFYMFSFQVHEKSVLLPLLPTTLLIAGSLDRSTIAWTTFATLMSTFSLYPLLARDGLILQYFVLLGLYAYLMGAWRLPKHPLALLIHVGGYVGAVAVHIAELWIGKVENLPDLWTVANCVVSFCAFVTVWGWVFIGMVKEVRRGKKGKME